MASRKRHKPVPDSHRARLGQRIRAIRERKGRSGLSVAKALGMSDGYYYDIERGGRGMKWETLVAIAEELGVPISEALGERAVTEATARFIDAIGAENLKYLESMPEDYLRREIEAMIGRYVTSIAHGRKDPPGGRPRRERKKAEKSRP